MQHFKTSSHDELRPACSIQTPKLSSSPLQPLLNLGVERIQDLKFLDDKLMMKTGMNAIQIRRCQQLLEIINGTGQANRELLSYNPTLEQNILGINKYLENSPILPGVVSSAAAEFSKTAVDAGNHVEERTQSQEIPGVEINSTNMDLHGLCLRYGLAQEKDRKINELREASDKGDTKASYELGLCYEYGIEVVEDKAKAAVLFELARSSGDLPLDAAVRLAMWYLNGTDDDLDDIKAVTLLIDVLDANDGTALNGLGFSYCHGRGTVKSPKEGVKLYGKALYEARSGLAAFNLGVCYRDGIGVGQDLAYAKELFDAVSSAESEVSYGSGTAALGQCYRYGLGVAKDEKKAVQLYQLAAEDGNGWGMCALGHCYESGVVVRKSYHQAVELYRRAIEAGAVGGKTSLGWCYEKGLGVNKNIRRSAELYKDAAEAGCPRAMNNLAHLYCAGLGCGG